MRLIGPVFLVGGQDYNMTYLDWPANDCNTYLIDTGDPLVLVDCGCGESLSAILGNVKEMGFRPRDITHVLLTHAHLPHAGGAEAMRRNGAQILASAQAAAVVRRAGIETSAYHYDHEFLPVEKVTELADGEELSLGRFTVRALALPGHSSSCIGYRLTMENREVLFCGDAVRSPGLPQTRGRLDYSHQDYVQTLCSLLDDPPDVLYPGHGTFCLSHAEHWIGAELRTLLASRTTSP